MDTIEVIRPDIQVVQELDPALVHGIPWSTIEPGIYNPVANTNHEYLKFVNTHLFCEEARRYGRYGYYTTAPFGSKDYDDYWDEQEERCTDGYSVGGIRVTGRHYFFLNFGRLKARKIDPVTGLEDSRNKRKIVTFPRFLDHQYYWFHEIEECFAEGPHEGRDMKGHCTLKSRRKGYTYQISSGVYMYNYNFVPASTNILAAYEKLHYKVTLNGIHFTLNHINKATDWAKRRDKLTQRDHFRASFVSKNEAGYEVEDGFMSEIQAVSFKDNPFKAIGESNFVIGFEEAGKFRGLMEAYIIAESTLRDGEIFTGVPLIWGTGGDMGAGTMDLAEFFWNAEVYGFRSYENIYEENAVGDCGWFVDDMWYLPGLYEDGAVTHFMVDKDGNSYRSITEKRLDEKREQKLKGSKAAYNLFLTQQPKKPSEALLQSTASIFDTVTAKNTLAMILMNQKKYVDAFRIGRMEIDPEHGRAYFNENRSLIPLYEFPIKDNKDKPGCVVIYEPPVRSATGEIERSRYIASVDPYDDDQSETRSVGSMFVLDRFTDRIVAHYKGRPAADIFYEQCRRLALYYNCKINYERDKKGLRGYFVNKGSLNVLVDEPEILKERGISKANIIGNNAKGTHASTAVNSWGVELSALWMDTGAYGEPEESEIVTLQKIRSIGLLREIINYVPDPKLNFDDISALGMLMIYREDLVRMKPKGRAVRKQGLENDPYFQKWRKQSSNIQRLRASSRLAIGRSKRR